MLAACLSCALEPAAVAAGLQQICVRQKRLLQSAAVGYRWPDRRHDFMGHPSHAFPTCAWHQTPSLHTPPQPAACLSALMAELQAHSCSAGRALLSRA